MKRLITITAMAMMLLAAHTRLATASENTVGDADGSAVPIAAAQEVERRASASASPPSSIRWLADSTPFRLDPASIAHAMQPADDPGYNNWQAEMDAARAGRRLGMYVGAGGVGAAILGYTMLNPAFDPSNPSSFETGGDTAAMLVMIGGLSAGAMGILQWFSRNRRVGELTREGEQAGYVSVRPLPGGAVATLAWSF